MKLLKTIGLTALFVMAIVGVIICLAKWKEESALAILSLATVWLCYTFAKEVIDKLH